MVPGAEECSVIDQSTVHMKQAAGLRKSRFSSYRVKQGLDSLALGRMMSDSRQLRIALYSHDTMGLGHMRRNLLIAQALTDAFPHASILMIAGSGQVNAFAMPPNVDCLTLPALRKEANGEYQARRLGVALPDLISLRAKTIRSALEGFQPDVLIVDNVPRGAVRELDAALAYLRATGRTRCILGLREVLDAPERVALEWQRAANEQCIRANYDAVWVYGDRRVYDAVREYQFAPDVAAKVRFTGYLDQRMRTVSATVDEQLAALDLPPGKLALCVLGGGQDGMELAEAFVQAELPEGYNGLLVTGPFMPTEARVRLEQAVAQHERMRVLSFVDEPAGLLERADRVIAMGGYNTTSEVLSFEKHALIVPRVRPRREQLIRAERLRDLGLCDMLHPADLSPAALSAWLARDLGAAPSARECLDLNGLARLPELLREALADGVQQREFGQLAALH